jgi:hypothetical protein
MRLSVFDDDSTFGGTTGMRPVVLRGTVTVSQLFSPNLFNIGDWIKAALRNNGFDVVNVRTSAAGWVGYSNNVEIELNVFNEHTADEARRNAITAIEGYTANFGLNKVFHNTTLSVAYDGYQQQQSGGSTPKPSSGPPSTYNQYSSGGSVSGFLDNFALGLGVSTPMAALIGAGVLIVILRR